MKALYRRAVALDAQQLSAEALADLNRVLSLSTDNALAKELHSTISAKVAAKKVLPPVPPPAPSATREVTIDVQKLRQKAQQLLGDGLNDKVIALLAGHLRAVDEPPFSELLQSDQTSLLHLLATAYSSTEDYAHAVAVQATILQIDPTNARALFKRAEGQLQLAAQASGEARHAALALAEQDIEAAVTARSGGTEVLALRQKLLRLRNIAPDPAATVPTPSKAPASSQSATNSATEGSVASSPSKTNAGSSRLQSDAQKELGNTAMTEKNFSTAVMHYSNAIKFDDTNLAAFNNRALAHLKLHAYAQAEADATVVIGPEDGGDHAASASNGSTEGVEALRLKALCRRAQARRAMGEAFLKQTSSAGASGSALTECQSVLTKALQDLQRLLKLDPSNKTALVEQKQSKDALNRCTDMQTVPLAVNATKGASGASNAPAATTGVAPASPEPSSTASAGTKPPRADMGRVSAMFGSPGPASISSSSSSPSTPSAFGGLGMVARSSKKLNGASVPATAVDEPPLSPVPQAAAATPSKTASTAKKTTASSPTPQVVLSAAPSEPPKTVYE